MKHVRFYLEFLDKQTKKRSGRTNKGHSGNVFAAFDPLGDGSFCNPDHFNYEGLGAVGYEPNDGVASVAASREYIQDLCKRIPEHLAREIHPALFAVLDRPE